LLAGDAWPHSPASNLDDMGKKTGDRDDHYSFDKSVPSCDLVLRQRERSVADVI
jgi:hypothetical protein